MRIPGPSSATGPTFKAARTAATHLIVRRHRFNAARDKMPAEGNARVPYRMFSDPEIYHAELTQPDPFLGPTWQYLPLAGELPQPGDYLTTFLGETPVIVTRGQDGEIHAMVNRCAHRGNLVCL